MGSPINFREQACLGQRSIGKIHCLCQRNKLETLYIPFGSFSLVGVSVSYHHLKTQTNCPLSGQYLMHHLALSLCPALPSNIIFQQQSLDISQTTHPNQKADLKRQNPDGFHLFRCFCRHPVLTETDS